MSKYSGYIVREWINYHHGEIHQLYSNERIKVDVGEAMGLTGGDNPYSREIAELLIHEEYARNEEKYTPGRFSKECLRDKVYVKDLRREEGLEEKIMGNVD